MQTADELVEEAQRLTSAPRSKSPIMVVYQSVVAALLYVCAAQKGMTPSTSSTASSSVTDTIKKLDKAKRLMKLAL